MSEEDIGAILTRARAKNERDGITGALLYHRGRFVQIIEGPDDRVRGCFDLIANDPRHRNVQIMREKSISSRQFPEWTMGFRAPSGDALTHLEGFEDFFSRRGRSRLEHAENEAQQFLEWLGEYWLPTV
jgi:hypothetical protein